MNFKSAILILALSSADKDADGIAGTYISLTYS